MVALLWPSVSLTTPFSAFCTAIHNFVTSEPRDFKFGTLTYCSKSHPADEKSSPKRAWSGSSDPFCEFCTAIHSFVTGEPVQFCSLAVLNPRVGHTMDVLSPFIPVLCHSDWLFHGESCPRLDVVHSGRAWPSSPTCTWHCSLHYLFLQATPLFPHGVTIVC